MRPGDAAALRHTDEPVSRGKGSTVQYLLHTYLSLQGWVAGLAFPPPLVVLLLVYAAGALVVRGWEGGREFPMGGMRCGLHRPLITAPIAQVFYGRGETFVGRSVSKPFIARVW